jgi:hypothetical protein
MCDALQSKKRGLSLEEKRQCVLEIFHNTKDVFQLKVYLFIYRAYCQDPYSTGLETRLDEFTAQSPEAEVHMGAVSTGRSMMNP